MRRWVRLHPRDAAQGWIYVTLARTLAEEQKHEEAAEVFESALQHNALRAPHDVLLYADLLVKLNKPERAAELYKQALNTTPDPREAEWARVQIVLNSAAKDGREPKSIAVASETDFDDPLLHRAAGAMQIGLHAVKVTEGE
jgi:uncharacterized protein HemY